jgi:hypothetical protein
MGGTTSSDNPANVEGDGSNVSVDPSSIPTATSPSPPSSSSSSTPSPSPTGSGSGAVEPQNVPSNNVGILDTAITTCTDYATYCQNSVNRGCKAAWSMACFEGGDFADPPATWPVDTCGICICDELNFVPVFPCSYEKRVNTNKIVANATTNTGPSVQPNTLNTPTSSIDGEYHYFCFTKAIDVFTTLCLFDSLSLLLFVMYVCVSLGVCEGI